MVPKYPFTCRKSGHFRLVPRCPEYTGSTVIMYMGKFFMNEILQKYEKFHDFDFQRVIMKLIELGHS